MRPSPCMMAGRRIAHVIGLLIAAPAIALVYAVLLAAYAAEVGGVAFAVFAGGLLLSLVARLVTRGRLPAESPDGTLTIRTSRLQALTVLWLGVGWCVPLALGMVPLADKAPVPVTAVAGFFLVVLPAATAISAFRNLAAPIRLIADTDGLTACGRGDLLRQGWLVTLPWSELGLAELRTAGDMEQVYVGRARGRDGLWLDLNGVDASPVEIVRAINRRVLQSRPPPATAA